MDRGGDALLDICCFRSHLFISLWLLVVLFVYLLCLTVKTDGFPVSTVHTGTHNLLLKAVDNLGFYSIFSAHIYSISPAKFMGLILIPKCIIVKNIKNF